MRKFWDRKTVLITGFEGFLGSSLARRLIGLNADIIGLDIRVNRRDTILERSDYSKIRVIKGSILDLDLLKRIFKNHHVKVVFHLAAEAIVGKCNRDPLLTLETNTRGSWNILEACRTSPKKPEVIVMASSDKAYGSCRDLPYKETFALAGIHPYDVSKSCADLICRAYAHTYGLPAVITRCGNIYGPGDFNFSRIIPDAFRCMASRKELLVRSDGKFVRDYVYIDDIVDGYILLSEQLQKLGLSGEAFNFSSGRPVTVIELLRKINQFSTGKARLTYRVMNQVKCEIKEQYLSSEKAKRTLKWSAKNTLEQGLLKTSCWYLGKIFKGAER